MRKSTKLLALVVAVLMCATALIACAQPTETAPAQEQAPADTAPTQDQAVEDAPPPVEDSGVFIGSIPITLRHDVHGNTAIWAEQIARERYGARFEIIDPDQDLSRSIAAVETFVAMGADGIILHPVTEDGVREIIQYVRSLDINIMTYNVFASCMQVPALLIDEASLAFEMGADMAKKWMEVHPDIPVAAGIVGWTDIMFCFDNRGGPWIMGVHSVVDNLPTPADGAAVFRNSAGDELYGATFWLHGGGNLEVAQQVTADAITMHPEVNIIYGTNVSNGLGVLAAYQEAGRGIAVDGLPLTELIASTDASAGELRFLADPTSSLKYALGMQPKNFAIAQVTMIMELINGTLDNDVYYERWTPDEYFNFFKNTIEELEEWFNIQYNPPVPLDLRAEIARGS